MVVLSLFYYSLLKATMAKTNIYCIYGLRSIYTAIPFYIGVGKETEDLKNKQIKIGIEVTKAELLRRLLDSYYNEHTLDIVLYKKDLTKAIANDLAIKAATIVKKRWCGCVMQNTIVAMTPEEEQEVLNKVLYELSEIPEEYSTPYNQYLDIVETRYQKLLRARERVKLSRQRRLLPEKVIVSNDQFSKFVEDSNKSDPFGESQDAPEI